MKRRIEVIRESWRRIRVERRGPALCSSCGESPELASLASAEDACGVSSQWLAGVIEAGALALWEVKGREPVVCLGCVKALKGERYMS